MSVRQEAFQSIRIRITLFPKDIHNIRQADFW